MEADAIEVRRTAAALLAARIGAPSRWRPLPHQVPPPGNWYGWLLMAGRGAGKTDACAEYVREHVAGPPCLPGPTPHWVGIIAPTQGDAVKACVLGPSGIKAHDPSAVGPVTTAGGTVVRWPNGSVAYLYGANGPEDVERMRAAGNTCLNWLEEFAAWRYLDATWDQMRFGLRSGPRPHWIASTTPKPKPLIKKLASGGIPNVATSYATMYDNPHLEQGVKDALEDAYAGTQIGAQELYGRLLEEDENALWKREQIEAARVPSDLVPDLIKVTVGVDPSGGAGEQGIVVAGKSGLIRPEGGGRSLHHGYVLADETVHLPPDGWGRRAVQAAVDWEADDIAVEINYGGDQAVAVIAAAAQKLGVNIPVRQVRATRGKAVRAQPVAALTAQGRWHHAGVFDALEDQLTSWYPELGWSPDRLDAMVWTAWHTRLVGTVVSGQGRFGGALAGRKIG
jgi:phage terminase large subunit-like protein